MTASEKSPEERYRALIIIGIILSVLIIAAVVVVFAVTRAKIAARNLPEQELLAQQIMDAWTDSVYNEAEAAIDMGNVPPDYYTRSVGNIQHESDSLRIALKKSCMNCPELDSLLRYLHDETNLCATEIQELRQRFQDTLDRPGVRQTFVTSEEFFSSTDGEELLLSHLQEYRRMAITYASMAGTDSPELYKTTFPLTDTDKNYVEIMTWDRSVFTEEPVDVLLFLDHLEKDLRYFENSILWGTTR
jgi:hypothetical protein